MIKKDRILRFKAKIDFITSNLELIPLEPKNELEKNGIFYSLLVSIDASMDLIAMYLKDNGIKVSDDYSNIDNLENAKLISNELSEKLRKCNGLRNYLVHRYNKVDDKIIFSSITEIKEVIYKLIRIIEEFLNEFKTNKD